MKRIASVLLLVAVMAMGSTVVQSAPGPGELVTICYYGVTQKVTPKLAERYMKLGAKMGACGQQGQPGAVGPQGQIPN